MKDLQTIKAHIRANQLAGREPYAGLTSAEIGRYNGALMFGDNDEAFPDQETWSRIVD
jgi:hypothetical protein